MIGQVQEINGTKQIVPLDGMSVPQLDLATPNNAVLKFDKPNNRIVGASKVKDEDYVIKYNYTMTGTADVAADIQSLVNSILTKGAGTYAGEFKRTGYSFGSYILTYFVDGDGKESVCGIVTEAISDINDSNWRVSYVKPTGQSAVWNIEKDVRNRTVIISSPNADPIVDIQNLANTACTWQSGSYEGYFERTGYTSGHYSFSVAHGYNVTGNVVLVGATNDNYSVSSKTDVYETALTHIILKSSEAEMDYKFLASVDMLSYFESLPTQRVSTFRLRSPNASNTPIGNNVDIDFWFTVSSLEVIQYRRVIAYDVRTNNIYTIQSYDDGNGNIVWRKWQGVFVENTEARALPVSLLTVGSGFASIVEDASHTNGLTLYRITANHYRLHINNLWLQCKSSGQAWSYAVVTNLQNAFSQLYGETRTPVQAFSIMALYNITAGNIGTAQFYTGWGDGFNLLLQDPLNGVGPSDGALINIIGDMDIYF